MHQRITVTVDGAEVSEAPLRQAVWLARQSGAALTGLFIIDGNWPDFIGNDWQSSMGARQGFLDYIREEQESQARAAEQQFRAAVEGMEARFELLGGDPIRLLAQRASDGSTDLLVTSRRVFQVSGRPILKTLGKELAAKATCALLLLP